MAFKTIRARGRTGSWTSRLAVVAAGWLFVLQMLAGFCFSHLFAGPAHAQNHFSVSQPLPTCSAIDVVDKTTPPAGKQIELCCVFHHGGDDQFLAPARSKRIDDQAYSNNQPAVPRIFDDSRIDDIERTGWLSSWSALAPPRNS